MLEKFPRLHARNGSLVYKKKLFCSILCIKLFNVEFKQVFFGKKTTGGLLFSANEGMNVSFNDHFTAREDMNSIN